jgi:hypothetical protein
MAEVADMVVVAVDTLPVIWAALVAFAWRAADMGMAAGPLVAA